ncbi:putative lipoprotein [Brevibacillus laterosporus GI-9]|uniref:DUF4309 domain-containing protein n=1 Tax=Brevibacillus TaxID=55080 RepID=UPI000240521A|nr:MULTISPECIES: DUF4309 domain-containing protein [Brevibacillus]MCR8963685.1 DUF4309 domain-containing protein [Brevibacillus laterosporus]MCZ0835841.1 DUF4309 domain-containing protein [Brevibacillus halotolerans]CCF16577.1 putative lipoprotein [Brevibacillus laterosporus GI-9]
MKAINVLTVFMAVSLIVIGCGTPKQADKEGTIAVTEAEKGKDTAEGMKSEKESNSKTKDENTIASETTSDSTTNESTENTTVKTSDKSTDKLTQPLDPNKSKLLLAIKDQAEKGKLKDIKTPLGTAYKEIEKTYGKPKSISNTECWTFSYDHPETTASFFYDHDSCGEELNQVKPTTKLNQITVDPAYYNITLTENDIRQGLGKPTEAYVNEAYGGYDMHYDVGKYQIFISVDEDSPNRSVNSISVRIPLNK